MELETLKSYIKTNLVSEFIRPSKSPACAQILFVQKSDGSLAYALTIEASITWLLRIGTLCPQSKNLSIAYVSTVETLITWLSRIGTRYPWSELLERFTQLDWTNAYHRMRVWDCNEWKTAFRTKYGHSVYQVMPSGLSNASAICQGCVSKIQAEKLTSSLRCIGTTSWSITRTLGSPTWRPYARFSSSSGNTASLPIWKNIVSIRRRFTSSAAGLRAGSTNRGWENWSREDLARAKISTRHPGVYRICQLLPAFHSGL